MGQENELARAKWLMLCALVFLISTCVSYQEFAYLINGRDAEADITKVYESRGRRGSTSLTAEYTFTEPGGTSRKGMESLPIDWDGPRSGKVPIRYTPGEDGSSRFAGRVRWLGVGFFAISLGAVLVFAFQLLREGAEDSKPRRRTR
jgi:hypothetical protein